jgi:hypothetical protein
MQVYLGGLFGIVGRVRNRHTRILPNAYRDSDMTRLPECDGMP